MILWNDARNLCFSGWKTEDRNQKCLTLIGVSDIGHPSSVIQPIGPKKIRKLEEKPAYRFSKKAKLSEAPILFHILLSKEPWLWENW